RHRTRIQTPGKRLSRRTRQRVVCKASEEMDISITHQNRDFQPRYSVVQIDFRKWQPDSGFKPHGVPPNQCWTGLSPDLVSAPLSISLFVRRPNNPRHARDTSVKSTVVRIFLETSRFTIRFEIGTSALAPLRLQCRSLRAVLDRSCISAPGHGES